MRIEQYANGVCQEICSNDLTASASTVDGLSLDDACVRIPTDFNDLRLLHKIAMTLPVSLASVERGFSKLSYIEQTELHHESRTAGIINVSIY
jgi:hypothetical protein